MTALRGLLPFPPPRSPEGIAVGGDVSDGALTGGGRDEIHD